MLCGHLLASTMDTIRPVCLTALKLVPSLGKTKNLLYPLLVSELGLLYYQAPARSGYFIDMTSLAFAIVPIVSTWELHVTFICSCSLPARPSAQTSTV